MKKWMVRGPTNRVHYDLTSLKAAKKAVQEELNDYPKGKAEIYQLLETAEREVLPVKFTSVSD